MKTITIEKNTVNTLDDLIREVNKGFSVIVKNHNMVEAKLDAQYKMILDIHNNYVTKEDFGRLESRFDTLEEKVDDLPTKDDFNNFKKEIVELLSKNKE